MGKKKKKNKQKKKNLKYIQSQDKLSLNNVYHIYPTLDIYHDFNDYIIQTIQLVQYDLNKQLSNYLIDIFDRKFKKIYNGMVLIIIYINIIRL